MQRVRPATAAASAVLVLLTSGLTFGLTSCGDEQPADDGPDADPVTIEITFEDGTVDPSGERVEVAAGQPVELVVEADAGGEIHVHSKPEQAFEYGEGTTTLPLTIDKPGVVDVESHDLEQVIVQLEVG